VFFNTTNTGFRFKPHLLLASLLNIIFFRILELSDFKHNSVWINEETARYVLFFLKYSSTIPACILIDMFSYNLQTISLNIKKNILVRLLFISKLNIKLSILSTSSCTFISSENLFLNANWMERECSEMNYITFLSKYDMRNLLLPYFENFKPLFKSNTSIGEFELFFNFCTLTISKFKISQ